MADRKVRVLVVEDHVDTQTVVRLYLGVLGFDFKIASDGVEALGTIPFFDPDVILLDLRMPVMDGWEFMREYQGPVPIVVLSAWSDMKELPRDPFAIVLKPSDMREVAVVLREAARSWRSVVVSGEG